MPDITITIPTVKVDILKLAFNYKDTILEEDPETHETSEVPNPVNAAQYLENHIIKFLKKKVRQYDVAQASKNSSFPLEEDQ